MDASSLELREFLTTSVKRSLEMALSGYLNWRLTIYRNRTIYLAKNAHIQSASDNWAIGFKRAIEMELRTLVPSMHGLLLEFLLSTDEIDLFFENYMNFGSTEDVEPSSDFDMVFKNVDSTTVITPKCENPTSPLPEEVLQHQKNPRNKKSKGSFKVSKKNKKQKNKSAKGASRSNICPVTKVEADDQE